MKKITLIILPLFMVFSCEEDIDLSNSLNYEFAHFGATNYDITAVLGNPATQSIQIIASTKSSTSRTINIEVDATSSANVSAYTVPASVTIAANETITTLEVGINPAGISPSGEALVLKMTPQEGAFTAPTTVINVTLFCPPQSPTVGTWSIVMQDQWGDSWDGASITVTVDGVSTDYTMPSGPDEITYTFDVAPGASTITVVYNEDSDYPSEHTFQMFTPNGDKVMDEGDFKNDNVPLDLTEKFNFCLF